MHSNVTNDCSISVEYVFQVNLHWLTLVEWICKKNLSPEEGNLNIRFSDFMNACGLASSFQSKDLKGVYS